MGFGLTSSFFPCGNGCQSTSLPAAGAGTDTAGPRTSLAIKRWDIAPVMITIAAPITALSLSLPANILWFLQRDELPTLLPAGTRDVQSRRALLRSLLLHRVTPNDRKLLQLHHRPGNWPRFITHPVHRGCGD